MSLFAKLAILAEYYIRNLDNEAPPGFGHHVLCGVVLRHLKDSDEEEEGEEEGNGWILEVTAEFPEGGHASCTVKYTLNIPADLPFSAVVDRLYAEIPQQAAA